MGPVNVCSFSSIFVCSEEILLLLLGDLLAKGDLLVGLLDGGTDAFVFLILLVFGGLQCISGSHLVHFNVLMEVVVTDL